MVEYTEGAGRGLVKKVDIPPWEVDESRDQAGNPVIEQAFLKGMTPEQRHRFYMGVVREMALREARRAKGWQVREYTAESDPEASPEQPA